MVGGSAQAFPRLQQDVVLHVQDPPRDDDFHPRPAELVLVEVVIRQREETITLRLEHPANPAADLVDHAQADHAVDQPLIAVVLGIWFPAKMLAQHTNQPLAKPIWYFVGTVALVMIYISMYGYGHFWDLYADSPESQNVAPITGKE